MSDPQVTVLTNNLLHKMSTLKVMAFALRQYLSIGCFELNASYSLFTVLYCTMLKKQNEIAGSPSPIEISSVVDVFLLQTVQASTNQQSDKNTSLAEEK